MKEDMEKGFLAHKFDDWSSEPIPNGWEKINQVIDADRSKSNRKPLWLGLAFLLTLSGGLYLFDQNSSFESTVGTIGTKTQTGIQLRASTLPLSTNQTDTQVAKIALASGLTDDAQSKSESQSVAKKLKTIDPLAIWQNQTIKSGRHSGQRKLETSSHKMDVNTLALIKSPELVTSSETSNENTDAQLISQKEAPFSTDESGYEAKVDEPIDANVSKISRSPILENTPANFSTTSPAADNIEFLQTRLTELAIPQTDFQMVVNRVQIEREFPITKKPNLWFYSVGGSVGYAPRSIEINQDETVRNIAVSNSGNGIQSWFGNVGFTIQNELKPWIRSFASVKLGVISNSISMTETAKDPSGFVMSMTDSVSFKMNPTWEQANGKMKQELIYSTIEFGLNPFLIPSKQSGPFASAVIWLALSQTISSDLVGASSGLQNSRENVALSYRLGYQHVFARFLRGEIYMAGMPDKILANSKGLSIKPQLVGMGFHYIFH